MELTPPPEDLSYNLAGTNQTFEASLETCSQWYGVFDGGALPESVEDQFHELEAAIEDAIMKEIAGRTRAGDIVTLVKMGEGEMDVDITADSSVRPSSSLNRTDGWRWILTRETRSAKA